MWIIAAGITLAVAVVVLSANGLSGIPFGWYGVIGAALLACVAFTLGYAE